MINKFSNSHALFTPPPVPHTCTTAIASQVLSASSFTSHFSIPPSQHIFLQVTRAVFMKQTSHQFPEWQPLFDPVWKQNQFQFFSVSHRIFPNLDLAFASSLACLYIDSWALVKLLAPLLAVHISLYPHALGKWWSYSLQGSPASFPHIRAGNTFTYPLKLGSRYHQ